MDWNDVILSDQLSYIMGNPPFVGARWMSLEQKRDVENIFKGWKSIGNLDYVSCWYKKAADYIGNNNIRAALVSTNSITQGESVSILWKPLFESGIHIDFAYRTFVWDSEASIKAHVHCVIVGFSRFINRIPKKIYSEGETVYAHNINSNLAALYDPLTMPTELRRAHTLNDKAVMAAYGFSTKMTEATCVTELLNLYQRMLQEKEK